MSVYSLFEKTGVLSWGGRLRLPIIVLLVSSGCAHLKVPLCYHRTFESLNGSIVVSEWGKPGTDSEGECVEVRMDRFDGESSKCQFEVWGRVTDSWVSDLDACGTPEAVVVSQSFGTGSYGDVFVVTRAAGLIPVMMPELADSIEKGYMGHDEFYLDGARNIVRIFPIYAAGDGNCCPSGGVRKIVYAFKNRQLVPVEHYDFRKQSPAL